MVTARHAKSLICALPRRLVNVQFSTAVFGVSGRRPALFGDIAVLPPCKAELVLRATQLRPFPRYERDPPTFAHVGCLYHFPQERR